MTEIANRKNDHLDFVLNSELDGFSYFDAYRLEHVSLPEINFADINTHIDFRGKRLNFPLLIDSISGGTRSRRKAS